MKSAINAFLSGLSKFNVYQKIAAVVLTLAMPLCVSTAVLAASDRRDSSSVPVKQTNLASSSSKPSSSSRPSSVDLIKVTLRTSSVEEDLEVQIVGEDGQMIVGPDFTLTVVGRDNGYKKSWTVNDGFLKLTKLASGDYTVAIDPLEGYEMPEEPIRCKVEKKVEHKQVDVSDKLVDESKIDVSKEDAAYAEQPRPVAPPKDTVEYVPSSQKEVPNDNAKTEYTYTVSQENITEDGFIKTKSGEKSQYKPIIEDGKLAGLTRYDNAPIAFESLDKAPHFALPDLIDEKDGIMVVDSGPSGTSDDNRDDSTSESVTPSPSRTPAESSSSESQESSSGSETDPGSTGTEGSTSSSSTTEPSPEPKPPVKVEIRDIFNPDGTLKAEYSDLAIDVATAEETHTVYYGWQNIDGHRYYFDKNGKKVTGTQVIDGVTYFFDSEGRLSNLVGIDVSKYQNSIDWHRVKNAGIEFAIIRAGYRGYGTGRLVEDPRFRSNISGATARGLKVGVYVFSQAVNAEEAVEEASMAISLSRGYNLAYPIFFDSEFSTSARDGRADPLSKAQRTALAVAFCETVRNSGYKAGVYASKSFFYGQLDYSQLANYNIWVAHFTSAPKTDFSYRYDIWQHSSTGSVPGVPTAVDMNIGYTVY